MSMTATLSEIASLPASQRLDLVYAIWDTIGESDTDAELDTQLREKLLRRCAELDANPKIAISWDEMKSRISGQK